jgi:hypothetical protein
VEHALVEGILLAEQAMLIQPVMVIRLHLLRLLRLLHLLRRVRILHLLRRVRILHLLHKRRVPLGQEPVHLSGEMSALMAQNIVLTPRISEVDQRPMQALLEQLAVVARLVRRHDADKRQNGSNDAHNFPFRLVRVTK